MISKIYFIDHIADSTLPKIRREEFLPALGIVIDMDNGMSYAINMINTLLTSDIDYAIIVNNPLLVDYTRDIANISYDNIYGFDFSNGEFVLFKDITIKKLKPNTIFTKLWMSDIFETTKRYYDAHL